MSKPLSNVFDVPEVDRVPAFLRRNAHRYREHTSDHNLPEGHLGGRDEDQDEDQDEAMSMQLVRRRRTIDIVDHDPRQSPPDVLSKRMVNGILNPYHPADITVHLKMSLQEDLDDSLEEFCRLQRLGDFSSAKLFFAENLQDHLDKPHVLIGYAEMLLEQGDYNTLSEIDDNTIYSATSNLKDSVDGRLLEVYWELMRLFAAYNKPSVSLTEYGAIISNALDLLRTTTSLERDISSTEIKMLALAYRLCNIPKEEDLKRLHDIFPSEFYKVLYTALLRQGRIWDLRDITLARMIIPGVDITEEWGGGNLDLRRRTQSFIKDWSSVTRGYDTSTTLAILDILVSLVLEQISRSSAVDDFVEEILDQSTLLVSSIMDNDNDSVRSRPFTRWMIAKAHVSDKTGPNHVESQVRYLRSSPGVVFYLRDAQLPQYVPLKDENPGWNSEHAAPEFESPIRVAVKTSRALADYHTEAMALQQLIKLSANPVKEFEELGHLQKVIQGDVSNYSKTLVSKFLISDTEDLRRNLKEEISGLFSIPDFSGCLSVLDSWTLNMLQSVLEGRGPVAERACKEASKDYKALPKAVQDYIHEKMPNLKERLGQNGRNPRNPKPNQTKLRNEDRLDVDRKAPDTKKRYPKAGQRDGYEASDESFEDLRATLKPHASSSKNFASHSDRQETRYQLDTAQEASIKKQEDRNDVDVAGANQRSPHRVFEQSSSTSDDDSYETPKRHIAKEYSNRRRHRESSYADSAQMLRTAQGILKNLEYELTWQDEGRPRGREKYRSRSNSNERRSDWSPSSVRSMSQSERGPPLRHLSSPPPGLFPATYYGNGDYGTEKELWLSRSPEPMTDVERRISDKNGREIRFQVVEDNTSDSEKKDKNVAAEEAGRENLETEPMTKEKEELPHSLTATTEETREHPSDSTDDARLFSPEPD
ncbi:hypothetical protein F4677DRAFT_415291 [Hypoxylon crocopeplum]|nr:hypothetical protein F4677DRAFT_415291 [Hypoxylon crocopeplum]